MVLRTAIIEARRPATKHDVDEVHVFVSVNVKHDGLTREELAVMRKELASAIMRAIPEVKYSPFYLADVKVRA